jgi:hypothetical protein
MCSLHLENVNPHCGSAPCPIGAKTDTIDAYLLTKAGRADIANMHQLNPDSEGIQKLKELTRDQDALIKAHARLLNQLTGR